MKILQVGALEDGCKETCIATTLQHCYCCGCSCTLSKWPSGILNNCKEPVVSHERQMVENAKGLLVGNVERAPSHLFVDLEALLHNAAQRQFNLQQFVCMCCWNWPLHTTTRSRLHLHPKNIKHSKSHTAMDCWTLKGTWLTSAGPLQRRVAWTSPLKSDPAANERVQKCVQEVRLPRNRSESTIINSQPRLINPDMYVQSAKNQLASPNWCKSGKRNLCTVRHSLLTSLPLMSSEPLQQKKCTLLNFLGKFIHIFKNTDTHLSVHPPLFISGSPWKLDLREL